MTSFMIKSAGIVFAKNASNVSPKTKGKCDSLKQILIRYKDHYYRWWELGM